MLHLALLPRFNDLGVTQMKWDGPKFFGIPFTELRKSLNYNSIQRPAGAVRVDPLVCRRQKTPSSAEDGGKNTLSSLLRLSIGKGLNDKCSG
jgi:hypothetical protein